MGIDHRRSGRRCQWQLEDVPAAAALVRTVHDDCRGKNKLTLTDVLVGEVWICSGQSNMEWRVRREFSAASSD